MGYPGALGIKFLKMKEETGQKFLAKVEKAVVDKGASGRMGTWALLLQLCRSSSIS